MTSENKKKNTGLFKKLTSASAFGSVLIVAVMVIIMLIIKNDYLAPQNILVLSKVLAVTAAIGFSQLVVMACGAMNLSIGNIGALAAVIAGWAMTNAGVHWGVGILLGILTGIIAGVINGFLVYRAGGVGVAGFLTTLATMSLYQGIMLTITQGKPFYGPDGKFEKAFLAVGNTKILGLPSSLWITIVIAIILAIMYSKLSIGRQMLAFGANYKAAELYGVSKFKVVMVSNILSGVLASIAGILAMIRIEAAQPGMGKDWMLMSFAAPLIGGSRNEGGKVSMFGAVVGALAITIIENALVHLRVDVYWNELIYGLVIIFAIALDRVRNIKKK
ncbi:MAG: ABC transporter permease [Christensenellaceae bacterium]|nr:ABC transporter permease [Christensenellaceae bacterium]